MKNIFIFKSSIELKNSILCKNWERVWELINYLKAK